LEWATAAAGRFDAKLSVVWVLPSALAWELAAVQINPDKRRHQMERQLRAACTAHCGLSGVTYRSRVVEGSPTAVLRREGSRPEVIMVVVGASHRGAIGDLVIGSVAHDLAHESPRPVVVVPGHADVTTTSGLDVRSRATTA
jgi:nucleotide-binding universal stress UspA family protein